MVNWNKPDASSLKSAFPGEVRDLATSAAKMSFSGDTNIPTDVIRWNSTDKKFEKYNGATWDSLNDWAAVASVTQAVTAGSWTPGTTEMQYLKFQDTFSVNFRLSGTQASAATANYQLTASPTLPASAYIATALIYCQKDSTTMIDVLIEKLTGDNAIGVYKTDGTTFATGTYLLKGQIFYAL